MKECVQVTKYFGTLFLCYTLTANEVYLVLPEALVKLYKPSSFLDFILKVFLKVYLYSVKIVSKATQLYVCKS